ncbi:MAG: hypothetical protein M3323_14560 [Actinomycetota bacterium]|nr:hypothetical protein [Actinomycetota bacterium]
MTAETGLIPAEELNLSFLADVFVAIAAIMVIHLIELAWIFREVNEWVAAAVVSGFKETNDFTSAAKDSGLAMVWPSRNDALRGEVTSAIEKARTRVFLLGVAFQEVIPLKSMLDSIMDKEGRDFDFKLLLVDPYRSPAVFRTLLESDQEGVQEILRHDRTQRYGPADPLLEQRLYTHFNSSFNIVKGYAKNSEVILKGTRFYGHTPTCWMVVADDVVYYQPYSFGRSPRRSDRKRFTGIGIDLPVFKFEAGSDTSDILLDHFQKLWLTSFMMLHSMQRRIEIKDQLIQDVFAQRLHWLKQVAGVLYRKDGKPRDERHHARQPCHASPQSLELRCSTATGEQLVRVRILDYTEDDLSIEVMDLDACRLARADVVTLRMDKEEKTPAAEIILNTILGDARMRDFVVAREPTRGARTIGLLKLTDQVEEPHQG